MNYSAAYYRLIEAARHQSLQGYVERHHIFPRALGGTNDPSNLIDLTPKQHFIAHRLLAKMYGGPMWAALAYMSRSGTKSAKGVCVTSRTYDYIKQQDAAWRSVRYSEVNHFRGKKHTEETRQKMRGPRSSVAGKNHPRFGKSLPMTNAIISAVNSYNPKAVVVDLTVRNRIDDMIVNKPKSLRRMLEQYRRSASMTAAMATRDITGSANPNFGNGAAISGEKNPMYGREHADSTKAKIGEKAKRRTICPHCGKDGNIANMARWHFDNCRDARNQALAASV